MFLFINRIIITSFNSNNNNTSISDNIIYVFSIVEPLIIRGPSCLFDGSCPLFLSIILTNNSFQRKSFKTILKRLYSCIHHNNYKSINQLLYILSELTIHSNNDFIIDFMKGLSSIFKYNNKNINENYDSIIL